MKLKKLNQKGMTLIEVLAAAVILSVCGLVAVTVLLLGNTMLGRARAYSQARIAAANAMESGAADSSAKTASFRINGVTVNFAGSVFSATEGTGDAVVTLRRFDVGILEDPAENLAQSFIDCFHKPISELRAAEKPYGGTYYNNTLMRQFLLENYYPSGWPVFDQSGYQRQLYSGTLYIQPYVQYTSQAAVETDMLLYAGATSTAGSFSSIYAVRVDGKWYYMPRPFDVGSKPESEWRADTINVVGKTMSDLRVLVENGTLRAYS